MDFQKIKTLGESAQYDICSACTKEGRVKSPLGKWIYPSPLPDGRTVYLLKILLKNTCSNNCFYCANRRDRNFSKTFFTPEELARLFMELYLQHKVNGLFLSSALGDDAIRTQSQMNKAVEILRQRHRFNGYVHLKILPSSTFQQVAEAAKLATRVSINLESPTAINLKSIAPEKNFEENIKRIDWINLLSRKQTNLVPAGSTTQFIVGGANETDKELINFSSELYKTHGIRRAYFSAFQPVDKTPLEELPPTPLIREHRLYQADFLIRKYGFSSGDILFDERDNLSLNIDPKLTWALVHPEKFPIEINTADFPTLLKIPGIGPTSAKRIIWMRKGKRINNLEEIKSTGAWTKRAESFILINGKKSVTSKPRQLELISC